MQHQGEWAALATAACWTVTALAFESAGRRIGSLAVNVIRLALALVFLTLANWLFRGVPAPTDANAQTWFWLSLSGLVGFTIGDLCLFRSYVVIGSRLGTLFMLLSPPLTALTGWVMLGEKLSPLDWGGMAITVLGVGLAASESRDQGDGAPAKRPASGYWLAFVAAGCQAFGLILSKRGIGDYNPFAATQIRALAGFAGFAVLYVIIGWWPRVVRSLADKKAMSRVALGSFFGPFLGVSLSLMAVQHTQAGVAGTIMSIVPILIIPPAALLFGERLTGRAVAGALFAVFGVALLFA